MATPRSVECSVERSWDKSHRRDVSAHAPVTSSPPRDRFSQTLQHFLDFLLPQKVQRYSYYGEVYTLLKRYCTRAGLSYDLSTLVECAAIGRDGRARDAFRTHISGMHRGRPNAGVRMSRDSPTCPRVWFIRYQTGSAFIN
ncbi:uncharacterized protein LOC115242615 [Formica exsecta]|uniref:uncharacterized protein LOC115242615 n=1 Tax=Formica exsecta TaxID=72781 RepID=UPI00114432B9|nr:uncharacterized protein LOC115242615 [Formica exsecta]